MDLDRPHHRTSTATTTATSEVFICFTSRLSSSSSSMKLSKSILSPSHARNSPLSLPTSLSRRLRANGSIKGGQSPATFPTTIGKKRGSGFDNPEPSSPKVTCIGQVKMKTKKKVKQSRSLSKRRNDVSFRKLEQAPDHVVNRVEERGLLIQNQRSSSVKFQPQECAAQRNPRWVHLPLTIYEALREFSCLFPCRSSCFSKNEKEKEEKVNGSREVNNGQRTCEDVVARWLVALQEGEAEKTSGIELVAPNGKEEEERMEEVRSRMRSSRRHVFEGIEFKDHESVEMKEGSVKEEKDTVSICIPPKNALLLMRCRSDPMKMADVTNQFLESTTQKEDDEEEDKKEIGENKDVEELVDAQNFEWNNEVEVIEKGIKVPEESSVSVDLVENEAVEVVEGEVEMEIESSKDEEKFKSGELTPETEQEDEEENEIKAHVQEVNSIEQVPESIVDQTTENIQDNQVPESEKEEEDSSIQSYSFFLENSNRECSETENEAEVLAEDAATLGVEEEEDERFKSTIKKVVEETLLLEDIDGEDVKQTHQEEEEEDAKSDAAISDPEKDEIEKEDGVHVVYPKESRKQHNESILPDCLLLMMCEPKLSMEVSKETWVCSTDFILPERKQAKAVKKKEIPEEPKRRRSIDSKPAAQGNKSHRHLLLQPPRSSCSLPAARVPAMFMATMIEPKLVNAVAYEPLVLTRCQSEPMRTAAAAAKLAPETCFWKNRKIEPHRRATFGVGAAGLGF